MFAHAHQTDARYGIFSELHPGATQVINVRNVTGVESAWKLLKKVNVEGAAYNSGERDPLHHCLDNTRNDVFRTIDNALESPDPYICWLSGQAGTGKSSIAYTLSDRLANQGKLLASFIFSQKRMERSRVDSFFHTIAYQLAVAFPSAKAMIMKTLEEDPSVIGKVLRDQCEKLIIEPLLSLPNEQRWTSPKVIVIDALDECQGDLQVEQLIFLLIDILRHSRIPPLKVFLTSRPEARVRVIFLNSSISPYVRPLHLGDFKANDDIRLYLTHSFDNIVRKRHLVLGDLRIAWPSQHDLSTLVTKADGLFIYASTAMKFIGDRGNPRHNFGTLLQEEQSSVAYQDLDQLYYRVVSSPNAEDGLVLTGIIVHLAVPLSVRELRNLLPWQPGDIEAALGAFSSVFLVPNNSEEPIQIYHASFHDFLVNPARSRGYSLDSSVYHRDLATYCLEFLVQTLRRDICDIKDPSLLNDEIGDLETRRLKNITGTLRYCCRYWATHHLSKASMDNRLQASLTIFMGKSLLYWLETLSLMGELGTAISSLQAASTWYKLTTPADDSLAELMDDAKRFTLQYFDGINGSALHVYYSALLFTPRDTLLRKTYQHELRDAFITVSRGLDERWSPCSRVIQLKSIVDSVAFSPDGSHFVSASEADGVKLWSTMTGLNVASFAAIGRHPRLVVFTPDGAHIVAGYEDGTISVWEPASASGRPVINERLHDQIVTSLAVSLRSTWLASTSEDTTAQLWDVRAGRARWKLSGHNKAVTCSAFSPDDVHFVSAGEDGNLCSWNVNTGRLEFRVTSHKATIASVAFSPCSTRIATGSVDRTVRIWDAATGEAVMKMKGQSAVVTVIFSTDSRRVIFASNDGTICCWNVDTRHPPMFIWGIATSLVERLLMEAVDVEWKIRWLTKVGLTRAAWFTYLRIRKVEHRIITAFSPDTIPFAFECYDLIFFLSDLSPHDGPMAFISPGFVEALAISSRGSHVASCTQNTINLWDTAFGYKSWKEFNAAFDGHVMRILASSLDGEYFVILSLLGYSLVDCRGRVICVLNRLLSIGYKPFHRKITTRALFSPDSSTLAYWHESDHKVKLFSTASGRQTRCFDVFTWRHTRRANAVTSAAFSPSSTSIACGYGDGTIRVWDAQIGSSLAVIKGHQGYITSIAFSYDGSHVVSGSNGGGIRCCRLPNGQFVGTFDHEETITGVVFSPGDSRIIYASDSRKIWVWQTGSGLFRHFASVDSNILSLGFSNDGTRLFCRTYHGATYMWDFLPHIDAPQPVEQEGRTSVGVVGKVLSSTIGDFCDYHQFSRYILRDGWIFDGDRRVCWVPISYRPRLDDDFRGTRDGLVMRVTSTDKLVILRVGEMPFAR